MNYNTTKYYICLSHIMHISASKYYCILRIGRLLLKASNSIATFLTALLPEPYDK